MFKLTEFRIFVISTDIEKLSIFEYVIVRYQGNIAPKPLLKSMGKEKNVKSFISLEGERKNISDAGFILLNDGKVVSKLLFRPIGDCKTSFETVNQTLVDVEYSYESVSKTFRLLRKIAPNLGKVS